MKKHAFLIMAHGSFDMLCSLVGVLDDERNDIFIHMDKKAEGFEPEYIKSAASLSSVVFLPQMSVRWGGYSQIKCMLALLETACGAGDYAYCHLLSGVDLPLKSMSEIHAFFDAHEGEEFIEYTSPSLDKNTLCRVSLYHFFNDWNISAERRRALEDRSLALQMRRGVDRTAGDATVYMKGATWFSITGALARFALSQKEDIRRRYRLTNCCDELFLQTLVYNSPYRERLHDKSFTADNFGNLRYTRWDDGQNSPAVLRAGDLAAIDASGCLFARKFDPSVDAEIAGIILNRVKSLK